MLNDRSYTSGKFAFELDGHRCGFLQNVEGGQMIAELATHKMGPNNYEKKNVTTVKWGDVKMRTGIGMSKGLYQWIQAAFDMGVLYKNGAITVANFNYKAERRMDLLNMLMTKVQMPTLDGASKDTGYFDITCAIEQIRWLKEGGQDVRGEVGPKQKAWHCSNWRYEMAGLPAKRIAKVEGLAWECKTTMDSIGDARENTIHPTATTVTDFTLHISMRDLEAWAAKAKDWFVDGNCLEPNEMTAAISLLAPDMNKELGRIELMNVGLKEFNAHGKLEAQTENVARFQVKCYAEQIKFYLTDVDA
jgi:phage tail-like protein